METRGIEPLTPALQRCTTASTLPSICNNVHPARPAGRLQPHSSTEVRVTSGVTLHRRCCRTRDGGSSHQRVPKRHPWTEVGVPDPHAAGADGQRAERHGLSPCDVGRRPNDHSPPHVIRVSILLLFFNKSLASDWPKLHRREIQLKSLVNKPPDRHSCSVELLTSIRSGHAAHHSCSCFCFCFALKFLSLLLKFLQ